jgi:hypothetical protein
MTRLQFLKSLLAAPVLLIAQKTEAKNEDVAEWCDECEYFITCIPRVFIDIEGGINRKEDKPNKIGKHGRCVEFGRCRKTIEQGGPLPFFGDDCCENPGRKKILQYCYECEYFRQNPDSFQLRGRTGNHGGALKTGQCILKKGYVPGGCFASSAGGWNDSYCSKGKLKR